MVAGSATCGISDEIAFVSSKRSLSSDLNRSSDVLAIARDLASFAPHSAGMSWDPWHLNEVAHAHAEAQASLEAFVSQNPFACLGASRGASDIAAFEAAAAAGSSPGAAAALTSAAATAAPAASSSSAGEVKDLIKTVDTGGEGSK